MLSLCLKKALQAGLVRFGLGASEHEISLEGRRTRLKMHCRIASTCATVLCLDPCSLRPPRRSRQHTLVQQPREAAILGGGRRSSLATQAAGLQQSLMDGLKKAFTKGQSSGAGNAAKSFNDTAPGWHELQQMVAAERERLNIPVPDLEAGPTSPLSLKRTFGKSGAPRIKLYRDHAAWCPYCQKVWLQLEEKQIPYTLEKINMRCYGPKPPDYVAKVPSGLLPAMEIDGLLVVESAEIMAILEAEFPDDRPLLPPPRSPERQRAEGLLRLERRLFSDWLRWLTSAWNHEQGKRDFIARMDEIERELGKEGGPYFLGWGYSMVDIVFAPFLERIAASIPYYKGLVVRGDGRWKNLDAWFDAMETRPAYLGTRSDHYTHVHDLPPQLGGCASAAGSEELAAAIDGQDNKSWSLPLPPLTATSVPEAYSPGEDPERDRLRAAARLVDNHAAVVKFAARGCGQPGNRPVTAPLSDPSAKSGEEHLGAIDAGLRLVAHALLKGPEATALNAGGGMPGEPVVKSAEYLRGRVGVPRDLPFPAARQLRAHLNWLIDSLQE